MVSVLLLLILLAADKPFVAAPAGTIPMRLEYSPTPEHHLIETMTGGVAAFDYDNDGLVDLFFANGAEQPSLRKSDPKYWNRMYRNAGGGKFTDVTEALGLQGEGFSMGVAAADFNNDGYTDLFVTGVNGNHLYQNKGGAAFVDVTAKAGAAGRKVWSVAAGWFDYDSDGFLDLFVVNYVSWDPAKEPRCENTYCHPKEYAGLANQLLHNNKDGTFTDVTAASGIGRYIGKGMGVAFGDLDGDGRMDAFVTNDTVPNFLFHNLGDGKFEEIAVRASAALNDDGRALSAMGVDWRDVDNDGREDIFYTALANETFPLLKNIGKNMFTDITYASRVGAATLTRSGWGAGIFDFDNDGRKDLFAAGADVQTNSETYSSRKSRQPNLILWNSANGQFRPEDIGDPALHRGTAFADLDNDGAIDIVVSRLGESPVILMNRSTKGAHWIGFKGLKPGTQVIIDGNQYNRSTTAAGYASSSDARVHFGLGAKDKVTEVEIRWPGGKTRKLTNVTVDRYLEVAEP
jgi:hypothetical protein